MSLSVGARLGHYEVTAKLGEGGMGEVWEATDTKLNRPVPAVRQDRTRQVGGDCNRIRLSASGSSRSSLSEGCKPCTVRGGGE